MTTIVWLNGPSRQSLIKTLPKQHIEIGCNYIRNDRPVDHVVCYDKPMMDALEREQGVAYWTRNYYAKPGVWNYVPANGTDPQNSGVLAIQLAHNLSHKNIYIIGLDWGITKETSYDYSHIRRAKKLPKHTNHCIKHLETFNRNNNIFVVHDGRPDVTIPVITKQNFLDAIQ